MKKKGVFIVVEGLDGSGKTTQAKILALRLREKRKAFFTQEPSRGKIGVFIRNHLLYGEKRPPTIVEALLFAADRIDHVKNEVQPAMDGGQIVVSDRYLYSSLAYQGSFGLSLDWIERVNQFALKPDLALFIDVDPETVFHRLKQRKSVMENLETQRRVREVYLKFVDKGDLIRINGDQTKSQVADDIFATVEKFLKTLI